MTYQQIFKDVKKYFDKANPSHFTQEFAFQFNITGEGEGIFYAAYKNGALSVEPYDYVDRDVIFEADGETLKAIAAGKLEVIDAVKAGRLAVDGDHEAAKQLMFLVNAKKEPAKKEAAKTDEKPAVKKAAPKAAASEAPKADAKEAPKADAKEAPKADVKEAPKADVKEAPKPVAEEAPKAAAKEAPKSASKKTSKASKGKK